ncbi:MAG: hypothetical protein ACAH59_02575, partial [Pseudobdellovibrionaceae bacterium]
VDWLRTLALSHPQLVKEGQSDNYMKTLFSFRQSIEAIAAQSSETPILLSVVNSDPKFLLMLGDLVQATSCQNYRTGGIIGTLLGYVIDAGVQAMVSYVVTEPNFKNPSDYKKVQDGISSKSLIESQFDGNKRVARFKLKSGEVIETDFLGYGYLRNALKLGHRLDGTPAVFLEKDYAQNHPHLQLLKDQHKYLLKEIAQAAKTEINGELIIRDSRSPGGIYSDAGGGTQFNEYKVNIPLLQKQ